LSTYIGRFAPSPTGPLHIGSLIAALASYLDARAHRGLWKLRIDDIDTTRCKAIYASEMKTCLQNFGLRWDGEATNQQVRAGIDGVYAKALQTLADQKVVYACICSRKEIADSALAVSGVSAEDAIYTGVCKHLNFPLTQPNSGVRLNVSDTAIKLHDRIQGMHTHALSHTCGDFILKRKDNLFAYQLAVVVDDYIERITHIVRGADLLDSTPRQIYLQQLLGYTTPSYAHLPVALTTAGEKLSKQTLAPPLPLQPSAAQASGTLLSCLTFLGQPTNGLAQLDSTAALLEAATQRWDVGAIARKAGLCWLA
jgi:glutamyl-Q tRNA(Asp) synthetase